MICYVCIFRQDNYCRAATAPLPPPPPFPSRFGQPNFVKVCPFPPLSFSFFICAACSLSVFFLFFLKKNFWKKFWVSSSLSFVTLDLSHTQPLRALRVRLKRYGIQVRDSFSLIFLRIVLCLQIALKFISSIQVFIFFGRSTSIYLPCNLYVSCRVGSWLVPARQKQSL